MSAFPALGYSFPFPLIPAKAGTQFFRKAGVWDQPLRQVSEIDAPKALGPGFRRDERVGEA